MLDEHMLKQQGFSDCRLKLIKGLQSKLMRGIQIASLVLYLVAILAEFVFHDITYEDRMNEYAALRDNTESYTSDHDQTKVALFGVEFGVTVLVLIDYILYMIGYGQVFFARPQTIITVILLLANLSLLVVFGVDKQLRYSLFGTKMFLGSLLLLVLSIQLHTHFANLSR